MASSAESARHASGSNAWICDIAGCGKSYRKECRLIEHQRSHTGERPYRCQHAGCEASYMRATHLTAHSRSHMKESQKPVKCTHGCDKAFWTSQHLRRHIVSCHADNDAIKGILPHHLADLGTSSTAGLYQCDNCERLFSKRKFLRQHVWEIHADSKQEKPFACSQPGCQQRFLTNAKRTQHMSIHDPTRYMCMFPHEQPTVFPTWRQLQKHVRECHPPQCPRPDCHKTFASRENLRKHMRQHELKDRMKSHDLQSDQANTDEVSQSDNEITNIQPSASTTSTDDPPLKQLGFIHDDPRRACTWNGCDRVLSSASALKSHVARVHRLERPFVCEMCGKGYGYRHLLRQHQRRTHVEEPGTQQGGDTMPYLMPLLDRDNRRRNVRQRVLPCPWDLLSGSSAKKDCSARYTRLYDLRRHMESAHSLHVSDEDLSDLLPEETRLLPNKRTKIDTTVQ